MSKEYFPHDYGARISLRGVRKDYGLQGVGFYWCFVEILHEEGGYIKEDDLDNIAYDLQVESELCKAITHNYDLFTVKKGKIYSDRVLRNIRKRAEISDARKKAASQRWDNRSEGEREPPPEQPQREQDTPDGSDEEDDFAKGIEFYKEQLDMRLGRWEDDFLKKADGDISYLLFSPVAGVRPMLENLFDLIKHKKTQRINGQSVSTLDFMSAIMGLLRNNDTQAELINVISEVNEKEARGEIKNKQNYLISALYNKAKLNGG